VSTGRPATQDPTASDSFTEFVHDHEAQLRHSLSAALGSELGREAAAEALTYAWEHWDRVGSMENPVGYLYRVGRDRGRRILRRDPPAFIPPSFGRIPMIEPGLPKALGKLPERQRLAVMLIHCFEWSFSEVANLLGVSKPTVQTHLARGMATLRREIGADE
jgi:DNA-directed RNA polymerase specialized sigma24 family protein